MPAVTLAFSWPAWYKRWPRVLRDVLRLMMGLTIAMCGYLLLSGQPVTGLVGAAVLAAFWKGYMVRRRSRRLEACAGCAELHAGGICTGFTLHAERIRQYEWAATERVIAAGYLPETFQGPVE